MTTAQVAIVVIFALLGAACIAFGVYAWLKPQVAAADRRMFTGLAPASILFGVMLILFAVNVAITTLSDYQASLRWWFLPPMSNGALDGMLGSPMVTIFLLAICVLFWWPKRDEGREMTPAQRLWEAGRAVATVLVGVLAMVLGTVLPLGGLWLIPLLWVGGLVAWWAYGRLVPRPVGQNSRSSKPDEAAPGASKSATE